MRTTPEIKDALYQLRDIARRNCCDEMTLAMIEAQIETVSYIEILCRRVAEGEQGKFTGVV